MPISFDQALGVHEQALRLRAKRADVLAANLANADTPHYKARDFDFNRALQSARQSQGVALKTTHANHLPADGNSSAEVLYRVPNQPSLDGNTVDSQTEQAAFAQNALEYQASLNFLSARFKSLRAAIRGE